MEEQPTLSSVLDRPPDQRCREYRYRFGQSLVFGLPVIALQLWGRALGGPEAGRWVGIMQALLSGWVCYVAATPMIVEGLIRMSLRRRVTADLMMGLIAAAAYVYSLVSVLHVVIGGKLWYEPLCFWITVSVLGLWNAWGYLRLTRRVGKTAKPA
jgi:cation transport ATPase